MWHLFSRLLTNVIISLKLQHLGYNLYNIVEDISLLIKVIRKLLRKNVAFVFSVIDKCYYLTKTATSWV